MGQERMSTLLCKAAVSHAAGCGEREDKKMKELEGGSPESGADSAVLADRCDISIVHPVGAVEGEGVGITSNLIHQPPWLSPAGQGTAHFAATASRR